jgi:TRAP-type C4-dicarboxylate transport system permease small subunit
MPLKALGGTALITVLDWAVWAWASSNGHDTVGLVAGVLLVPLALGLAGLAAMTVARLVRTAAERGAERRRATPAALTDAAKGTASDSPPATTTPRRRIAA